MRVFTLIWAALLPFYLQAQQDADFISLDAFVKEYELKQSIDALTFNYQTYYLQLEELAEVLQFQLDGDRNTGWIFSEKNQFKIENNIITFSNNPFCKQAKLLLLDDEYFIDLDELEKCIGIKSKVNTNKLKVNFYPLVPLPMLERIEREARHKLKANNTQIKHKELEAEYSWASYPYVEMNYRHSLNREKAQTYNFNLLGNVDLAKHNNRYSFTQTDSSKSARVSLNKKWKLTDQHLYYQLGDTFGLANTFLTSANQGRGVSLTTNLQGLQERQFQRIEGDAPSGWEAELFSGSYSIDYQLVDSSGQYLFEMVPIRYGINEFKVVLYGPQGQKRVRKIQFNNLALDIKPGQVKPEFSLVDSGRTLVWPNNKQDLGLVSKGKLNLGLTERLAWSLGYEYNQKQDIGLITSGFASLFDTTKWYLDLAWSPKLTRPVLNLKSTSWIWGHTLNLSYIKQDARLSAIRHQINATFVGRSNWLHYTLNLNHNVLATTSSKKAELLLATNMRSFSLNHRLSYSSSKSNQSLNGRLHASLSTKIARFSAQTFYLIDPVSKVKELRLSANKSLFSYVVNLQTQRDYSRSLNLASLSISRQFSYVNLGVTFELDSQQNWRSYLNLATGFGFKPRNIKWLNAGASNLASIKVKVFKDTNYNGVLDLEDTPLQDVKFFGQNHWQNSATDEYGEAILTGAKTSSAQYIELDFNSLEDPFLSTDNAAYMVKNHAGGLNQLLIPLIKTFELEGEVVIFKNQEKKSKGGIPVELINLVFQDTASKQTTEYDGFFLFEKLKPGKYEVKVSQEYLDRKKFVQQQTVQFEIKPGGEEVIELDTITLLAM